MMYDVAKLNVSFGWGEARKNSGLALVAVALFTLSASRASANKKGILCICLHFYRVCRDLRKKKCF